MGGAGNHALVVRDLVVGEGATRVPLVECPELVVERGSVVGDFWAVRFREVESSSRADGSPDGAAGRGFPARTGIRFSRSARSREDACQLLWAGSAEWRPGGCLDCAGKHPGGVCNRWCPCRAR